MTVPMETTGRYLVLLDQDSPAEGAAELHRSAGLRVADVAVGAELDAADGLVLPELGVAVVEADPDQHAAILIAAQAPGPVQVVEPERVVRAIGQPARPSLAAESVYTWGLQAIGMRSSSAAGLGVRVAVLDTGLDLHHPDLDGRDVVPRSFVAGETAQDGNGHGTHCAGTACGPRAPRTAPGYGVASLASIYAGKVLSDEGSGADGGILAGLSWAVTNRCRVVSMSLGASVLAGDPYSRVWERTAQRAMARGTLIVAAAGNESDRRSGLIAPVGHPANCPSIMAVGAVDYRLHIAPFSCGTVDSVGQVDIVGPGVDVYSSWPMPARYRRISGTSMATPHVAGAAAVLAGLDPHATPQTLWTRLVQTARRLDQPSTDVGAGLVRVSA